MPEMRFIGRGYKRKKRVYLYRCTVCKKVEHWEKYTNHAIHDCDKEIKKSLFGRIGNFFKTKSY